MWSKGRQNQLQQEKSNEKEYKPILMDYNCTNFNFMNSLQNIYVFAC